MNDFARHIRIFDAQPTDDLVEKRTRAINELSQAFKRKTDVSALLILACDLVGGVQIGRLPSAVRDQVAKAINKASPSFDPEGNDLEVLACGLMAALQYVRTAKPAGPAPSVHDLFACALHSGLQFQTPLTEPRLEGLRQELHDAALEILRKRSEDGRKRLRIPDIAVPQSVEALIGSVVNAAVKETIDNLRINARLDREELDILWWILADWSELLTSHFSRRSDLATVIAGGLEMARKLKHLPAEAHFQLVSRHVDSGKLSNLHELLEAVSKDVSSLRRELDAVSSIVSSNRILFPLAAALIEGTSAIGSADNQRSYVEWARRSLLEGVLAREILSVKS